MSERGTAMMGSAIASGPDRARIAAENAVACPLLEGVTLNGARGVLVYITASEESMKMKETKTVMNIITNFTAKGAQVIYGSAYDDSMGDSMRVTVVATGLDGGKDKEVAPIDKPAEKQDVWKHNDRTFTETKETDPWAPRQTQQAAAKVTQAQPEQTQQSVLSEPKPVTLDPVQPEPQPQPVQQPQTEPEKEEKAADEWETGWWSIRHDTK